MPPVVEQPTLTPVPSKIDGPWDKSMGMRHPDRPCMKANSCGPDTRGLQLINSDPYDINNPVSLAARGGAKSRNEDPDKPRETMEWQGLQRTRL